MKIKKLFALASVTALSGAIAVVSVSGCSSTKIFILDDSGGGDTGALDGNVGISDARPDTKTFPKDALVEEDSPGPGTTCPPSTPITQADIGLTWIAPGAPQAACTQADYDALKAVFAASKGSAKFSDIELALKTSGGACATCTFTPSKGARWGVIIKDGASVVADNSSGSCYGQNSNAACGKAAFELDTCVDIACPPGDCPNVPACTKLAVAAKGPCGAFASTFQTACPGASTLADLCDNFIKTIAASCGPGLDASL